MRSWVEWPISRRTSRGRCPARNGQSCPCASKFSDATPPRRSGTRRSSWSTIGRRTSDLRESRMARILIADDDEIMRDSVALTLAREGHEVVAANDGPAAVARLGAGGRFDLLLTD